MRKNIVKFSQESQKLADIALRQLRKQLPILELSSIIQKRDSALESYTPPDSVEHLMRSMMVQKLPKKVA